VGLVLRRSLFIEGATPGTRTDADHAGEHPGQVALIGKAAGQRHIRERQAAIAQLLLGQKTIYGATYAATTGHKYRLDHDWSIKAFFGKKRPIVQMRDSSESNRRFARPLAPRRVSCFAAGTSNRR
jgi:hypothetical protein